MTENEKRTTLRVPVALRIRLRYEAVDQFISKFAINISRGGMFLSSRNPKPPGTEVYFEICLADESPVIEGTGEVRWIHEYNRRRPDEPHGMGIQFRQLSDKSWPVLDRIIDHRRDIGEHDDSSIPEPRPDPQRLDAAVLLEAAEPLGEVPDQADRGAEHGGCEPDEHLLGEPLYTQTPQGSSARSARSGEDGPKSQPNLLADDLLAASTSFGQSEPSRERAAPRGTDPPLVRAALARARTLAGEAREGDDFDRELDELLEEHAAPVEVTVDAASRELAERLGGAPVARRATSSPGHEAPEEIDVTGNAAGRAIVVPDREPRVGRPASSHLDARHADGAATTGRWLLEGSPRNKS